MLDAVTDGTPCFMNNMSRNICVNGVCKVVWLGKRLKETGEEGGGIVVEPDETSCSVTIVSWRVEFFCANFHLM